MDYKNPISIFGYLVFLYDLAEQYEIHIKFSSDEMIPPTKRQMDSIIEYLEDEGFVKPPKKIALCVMKFNK